MKLILKQSVPNLGDVGEVVNVKPGFGRNYLCLLYTSDAADE